MRVSGRIGDLVLHRQWIALLLEHYYDPMYEYQLAKREGEVLFRGDRAAVIAWAAGAASVLAAASIQRDLVLVGGGHSHVLALRMLAMRHRGLAHHAGVAGLATLPTPVCCRAWSRATTRFEQAHIDLARLCQWAGVRFIAAEVTALDPRARRLSLAGRPAIRVRPGEYRYRLAAGAGLGARRQSVRHAGQTGGRLVAALAGTARPRHCA